MGTKRSDSLFPELVLKYKYLKTVLVFLSKDGERTRTFDRYYRTNWILSVRLTDLEAGMRRVSTREVSASPRIHNNVSELDDLGIEARVERDPRRLAVRVDADLLERRAAAEHREYVRE